MKIKRNVIEKIIKEEMKKVIKEDDQYGVEISNFSHEIAAAIENKRNKLHPSKATFKDRQQRQKILKEIINELVYIFGL
jgi:hypothetical protein